jgi:hypothetical protein
MHWKGPLRNRWTVPTEQIRLQSSDGPSHSCYSLRHTPALQIDSHTPKCSDDGRLFATC